MPGGVRYNFVSEDMQLVLPRYKRETVLHEYHDSPMAGPSSAERMIARLAAKYYWPEMGRQITKHVRKFIDC